LKARLYIRIVGKRMVDLETEFIGWPERHSIVNGVRISFDRAVVEIFVLCQTAAEIIIEVKPQCCFIINRASQKRRQAVRMLSPLSAV